MNKKSMIYGFFGFIAILFIIVLVFMIGIISAPPENWIIDGDSVYINDSNVFINVTPHTSNNPVIELTSKVYSGEIDVIVGFDTSEITPKKAEYNPHQESVLNSYTCEGDFFNYTISKKHFWCYENITTYDNSTKQINGSMIKLVYEHDFEYGYEENKTAYWNEETIVWTDVSGIFNKINYDFKGFDTWYYIKGFNINSGKIYKLKLSLQPKNINTPSYKYFFGVKPSSETLQEAIFNNHFYYIDPWTADLNYKIVSYYKLDEEASNGEAITDEFGNYSGVNNFGVNTTGKIGYAYDFNGTNPYVNINLSDMDLVSDDFSINCWIYPTYVEMKGSFTDKRPYGGGDNDDSWNFEISDLGSKKIDICLANTNCATTVSTLNNNTWYMATTTYDNSTGNLTIYLNGVLESYFANTNAGSNQASGNALIGGEARSSATVNFEGRVDECGFWTTVLNSSVISQLYNSGDGITYTIPNTAPTVTFVAPADNYNSTSNSVTLSILPKDAEDSNNLFTGIYINASGWTFNATNSSSFNNTNTNFTLTLPEGTYLYAGFVNDTLGSSALTGTNRTLTIDQTAPTITLPVYTNATVKKNTGTLTLNVSVSDAGVGLATNCFINVNGTNQTIAVSSGWCNTTDGNLTDLTDGNQTITIYMNDTLNNMAINNNYVVWVDTTAPTIILNNPVDTANSSATSNTFSATISDNVAVNYSILYGNFSGSWAVNSTNTSVVNNTQVNFTIDVQDGYFIWNYWANDSAGNSAFNSTSNRTLLVDTTDPVTNFYSPDNTTNSSDSTNTFVFNFTDNLGLKNSTLYIWDSDGNQLQGLGEYTGTSYEMSECGSRKGIVDVGDFLYVSSDYENAICKFYANNFSYLSNFSVDSEFTDDTPGTMTTDGTYIWVATFGSSNLTNAPVYKYWENGTYTGEVIYHTQADPYQYGVGRVGIEYYDGYLWFGDGWRDRIFKYYTNGTYTGTNISLPNGMGMSIHDILFYDNYLWITYSGNVWRLFLNGTYSDFSFSLYGNGIDVTYSGSGLTEYNGYFYKGWENETAPFYDWWGLFYSTSIALPTKNITGTSNSTSWEVNFVVDDTYQWNAYTCDSAGNCAFNSTNRTITIDATNPSVSYDATTDSSGYYDRDYILVNISATDTNLDSVILNWNGTNETFDNNDGVGSYWENKTGLADGNYTFYGWANDTSGRYTLVTTREVAIDTTPPQITSPANETLSYLDSLSVDFEATDSGIGADESTWTVNDSTNFTIDSNGGLTNNTVLTANIYLLNITIDDYLGNQNSTIYNVTVNQGTPTLSLSVTNSTYPTNGLINASESNLGDDDLTYNLYIDDVLETSGSTIDLTKHLGAENYTIVYNTSGGVNYTTASETLILGIANGTLSGSINSSSGSFIVEYAESTYISYTETNTGDDDVNYTLYNNSYFFLNNTEFNESLGTYIIVLNSSGGANYSANSNISTQVLTFQDTTNPLISYGTGIEDNNSYVSQTYIFTNVTITELLEDTVTFSIYNETDTVDQTSYTDSTHNINWTSLPDAVYRYNVTVNDTSNNKNTTETRYITIDTTIPIPVLTRPESSATKTYNKSTDIPLNFTVTETNLDSCWFSVKMQNGTYYFTNESVTLCTNTTFNLTFSGYYTIYLYVNDSASNENSTNQTFVVSTEAPQITLDTPSNNTYSDGQNLYFNFTTTDFDGINHCDLYENWSGSWNLNETFNFVTSGIQESTIKNISEGIYLWNVFCEDKLNTVNNSRLNYTLNIDLTAPNVTISDANNSQVLGLTFTIHYNITDDRNLSLCYFTLRDSSGVVHNYNANSSLNCSASSRTLSALSVGTFILNVWGEDTAGNKNMTQLYVKTTLVSPPSGGGLPTTGLIPSVNFSITTINFKDRMDVTIATETTKPRKKQFYLINEGLEPIKVKVECNTEEVNQSSKKTNICDYVYFPIENFDVSPNVQNPTIGEVYVDSPNNTDYGDKYFFNIIAINEGNAQVDSLSTKAQASILGIFYKWKFAPFQKGIPDIEKKSYPVILGSMLLAFVISFIAIIILWKYEMKIAGIFISIGIFIISTISLLILS